MPGKLKRYGQDPNNKGRGPGLYWHRGNGVYSKYEGKVDAVVKHRRNRSIPMRMPGSTKAEKIDYAEKYVPHYGDFKTKGNQKTSRYPGAKEGPKKGFY